MRGLVCPPWEAQPDFLQWKDEVTGLSCAARKIRDTMTLSGYVLVSAGHPWHGKKYSDLSTVVVHGGVTYAQSPHWAGAIELWAVGFDCGHEGDYVPRWPVYSGFIVPRLERFAPATGKPEDYKTIEFVKAECAKLAHQAKTKRV